MSNTDNFEAKTKARSLQGHGQTYTRTSHVQYSCWKKKEIRCG